MTYAPIILVLLSVVLLRSMKKEGLSAPARRMRKYGAIALGVAAVVLAILAVLDDISDPDADDITTLSGDRMR